MLGAASDQLEPMMTPGTNTAADATTAIAPRWRSQAARAEPTRPCSAGLGLSDMCGYQR